jgi:predicted O-methyltransferase YrrM
MAAMVENPESYFRQFIPRRDHLLKELEAEAVRDNIPIVGPVVGELLYILARTSAASAILELGTATGYSAIYLSRALDPDHGRLVTMESHPDMAERAKANIRRAGLESLVDVQIGDAVAALQQMEDSFDLIFLDIEKTDYQKILPDCRRLLRKGGLMVADNVGFEAAKPFNRSIFSSPDWTVVHLFTFLPAHSPENDGLCLALRL